MLMLSLNNFIGSVHVSAPAVLGPPQMLSLVEMRDDAHPKLVLINIPPPPVTHGLSIVCLHVYSEPVSMGFQNNNNKKKCVNAR